MGEWHTVRWQSASYGPYSFGLLLGYVWSTNEKWLLHFSVVENISKEHFVMRKLYYIKISMSIKKVPLEHSYAHLFTHCLWLKSLKYLLCGPL